MTDRPPTLKLVIKAKQRLDAPEKTVLLPYVLVAFLQVGACARRPRPSNLLSRFSVCQQSTQTLVQRLTLSPGLKRKVAYTSDRSDQVRSGQVRSGQISSPFDGLDIFTAGMSLILMHMMVTMHLRSSLPGWDLNDLHDTGLAHVDFSRV